MKTKAPKRPYSQPYEPRKPVPYEPRKPVEEYEDWEIVADFSDKLSVDVQTILDTIGQDNIQNYTLSTGEDDYSQYNIFLQRKVIKPNKSYQADLKRYNKALVKYNAELVKYKEELKIYKDYEKSLEEAAEQLKLEDEKKLYQKLKKKFG